MARRTLALLAALVAFATSAASALHYARPATAIDSRCTEGVYCVVVTWTGSVHGGIDFSGDAIAAMGVEHDYPQCLPGCPTPPVFSTRARVASIRDIIAATGAGFVPEAVTAATISNSDRSKVATLNLPLDLLDPSEDDFLPFSGVEIQPGIYTQGEGTNGLTFIRPQRFDGDPNVNDDVETFGGGTMYVDFTVSGSVLHPTLDLSDRSIDPGDTVTFTAALPEGSQGTPSYTFDFGSGEGSSPTGTASQITHTYDTGGQYTVVVHATDPSGGKGDSAQYTIDVGDPPTSTSSTPAPGHGGGATSNPVPGPTTGAGHQTAASTSGSPAPTHSSAVTSASSVPRTSALPTAETSRGSVVRNPTRSSASSQGAAASANGLVGVQGVLLNPDGSTPVIPVDQRSGGAGQAAASRQEVVADTPWPVFAVALSAAVVVLLALGALGESRRPRRSRGRGSRA